MEAGRGTSGPSSTGREPVAAMRLGPKLGVPAPLKGVLELDLPLTPLCPK